MSVKDVKEEKVNGVSLTNFVGASGPIWPSLRADLAGPAGPAGPNHILFFSRPNRKNDTRKLEKVELTHISLKGC
jgi:hypothetical protein